MGGKKKLFVGLGGVKQAFCRDGPEEDKKGGGNASLWKKNWARKVVAFFSKKGGEQSNKGRGTFSRGEGGGF